MPSSIDLTGVWRLVASDGAHETKISIPGDVHSALQAAHLIPDPYIGRNENEVQWVSEANWTIERTFHLPSAEGDWYLDLTGLDTIATVRMNGEVVLKADNCFRRYRPCVTHALKPGDNTIRIHFQSSIAEGAARQDAQPFYIPYSAINSPIPNGNMLRKPQCHFGWDWNIALAPLGLYGAIALKRLEVARVEHITTTQTHGPEGVAVEVSVTLYGHADGVLPVSLSFGGENVTINASVTKGQTVVSHRFEVDQPKLWWPAGNGKQPLYPLEVETPYERHEQQIGLRHVELDTSKDEAGRRFALKVNGREIFCRGANWIPADALFSRTSREKTRALLQSAVDANMNMIRVWGGGFYEDDWFYEICDELGLMVWQDFQFACNLYPSTPDFLENVAEEVDYQVRRLMSHPSIVLWCGDNELVGALNWFEESRNNRDRYLVSYDRLNRTIEVAMKKAAPDAIWWPSSPAAGYLDYGDAWHADGSGDMHYWSVWHENKSFDAYRTVRPRFCSEFGFQSYTSLPVIKQFADAKDMNIASPVMELHQKNVGGNERIAGTTFRNFRFPRDFAGFVYLSQVQQALAIKTAVDFWRSLKPHCMGTLYWQLNDTWPVASWSSLDYGGRWKILHYFAQRFFQPVAVAAIPAEDGQEIALSVVNDNFNEVTVSISLSALDCAGHRRHLCAVDAMCGPDAAVKALTLPVADLRPGEILAWQFTASNGMGGKGHYVHGTYKALELELANLSMQVRPAPQGGFDIEVSAAGLALFVLVETDVSGRYSDNAFDLAAGETHQITFIPDDPLADAPEFRLYDLHACTAAG
ncbi:beta-mannosidase [Oryzifoliimicrobium ureilyticus]|uniref:beta-mannosidase n=1 Tax=Oryzifoliimicrobium ureilyticus TaxID=3113724 RepID=UPI0030766998